MRKVAIIKSYSYSIDDWRTDNIVSSITEWTDVSEEDFQILKGRVSCTFDGEGIFTLLELPTKEAQEQLIYRTVEDHLKEARKEQEREEKAKRKRKELAEKRKKSKEQKELELYERLRTQYEKESKEFMRAIDES